jgi:hypothetical protein
MYVRFEVKLMLSFGTKIAKVLSTIARTVLEDICDKPIRIQSYCAVARLHRVWERDGRFVARDTVN